MAHKIRIRLKAYDHKLLDAAAQEIVDTARRTRASVAGPMRATFSNVPRPIFTRIATVATRTSTPVAIVALPIDSGLCFEAPWWSTVHGPWPNPPSTTSPTPAPNTVSPTTSWGRRRTVVGIGGP